MGIGSSLAENRQETEGSPYSMQSVGAHGQVLFVPTKHLPLKSQDQELWFPQSSVEEWL